MPTIVEAIAKAPQDVQPALFDLADALRTDRIVDHIDLNVTRLDAALGRLAEAQRRTEARVEELAQAQARTERAVQELARQVGGLSDTIGFTIEEMGRLRVHDYLERRGYAIDVIDRRLFTTARGELEFDLYACFGSAGT